MRIIRAFVLVLATVLILPAGVSAKKKKDKKEENIEAAATEPPVSDLSKWSKETLKTLPAQIDGVTIYRPTVNEEGRIEISELVDIPQINQTDIFVSAVVFAAENMERGVDAIETIDFDTRRFIIKRVVNKGELNEASTYSYTTAFQAADNMLSFVSYDIDIEYKEKGIITRHMAIEKMKPSSNKKHAELIEDFSVNNSKYIKEMSDFISKNTVLEVSHWQEIKAGKVVNGMNETEVKLVGGAPVSVRDMGERSKWMYSNDFVVVFTNGVVSTVIQ